MSKIMHKLYYPILNSAASGRNGLQIFLDRFYLENLLAPCFNSPRLYENDNGYCLTIALPGLNKNDLSIHIEGTTLVISSKKSGVHATVGIDRDVLYNYILPANTDVNNVSAKCRNGLLTIHMQKVTGTRKRVKVEATGEQVVPRGPFQLQTWWKRIKEKVNLTGAFRWWRPKPSGSFIR
jgi:hypothetical protein